MVVQSVILSNVLKVAGPGNNVVINLPSLTNYDDQYHQYINTSSSITSIHHHH